MDYFFHPVQQQQQPLHVGLHSAQPEEPRDAVIPLASSFEYNNYASGYSDSSFLPHPPPRPSNAVQHSPPQSAAAQRNSLHQSIDMVRDDLAQYIFSEFVEEPLAEKRSSSEEKDAVTPAQSRRKAQNRAAQRAFRERKERHVRELEQKLNDLQAKSMSLHADNERLKRELAKIVTENEILRATGDSGQSSPDERGSSSSSSRNNDINNDDDKNNATIANGPTRYLPTDMHKTIADIHKTGSLPHRIVINPESGDRLLNAKATWDFIQAHPLYEKGLIDIGDVCERLKSFTRCDGQGPVYEQGQVQKTIEESVACGNDELI
ncbi:hypothetical protein UA08_04261 [Talaromyces atroroseus]|uniref:BZIP domain-containing protein n=1 Tax=Talaromyces atroroseus TaxID=1441469 RepID=A0A1Q5Q903_TALAT|nr:hypothetical protein UA08_04261 [Talaromyces atroroseus]OKL60509.1 hypothetical protein UA08_04261 [Talaromyces atroroseus]